MISIPYGRQTISELDILAVSKSLRSEYLTQGPLIQKFEEALCNYLGVQFCVVVNSGTAALHTAYFACGLKTGQEIITSPMTFAATGNAALYLGATVKFSDIDIKTGNLNPNLISKKISRKSSLIVPIHYAGLPSDLQAFYALKNAHACSIVEDACHALGAEYKGKKIGSCQYSDATVFSFHPVKHITTGEGGAIATNDPEIYRKALLFRSHGITKNSKDFVNSSPGSWYHEMQFLGFNYRLSDFQAALGLSQLKRLDSFLEKRRRIAAQYNTAFSDNSFFDIQPTNKDVLHAYHLYPIMLKSKYSAQRPRVFEALRNKGLWVQVHYLPVYKHPYYQSIGYKNEHQPLAESFYQSQISLPMYPAMTKSEVKYVIKTVKETCNDANK